MIPYEPRDLFKPFHARSERFACIVAHRRAGKTVACVGDLVARAMFEIKGHRPQLAYVAPFYSQAKKVAWEYLTEMVQDIPGSSINKSELSVRFPTASGDEAMIQLAGGDNQDSLRGLYLDLVILDEFAQMPQGLWSKVIRPALADRQGSATVIGTPAGKNSFYDLFTSAKDDPDWFVGYYPASKTGILPASELNAARRSMSEPEYEQEFECSFTAAIQGAYWGPQMSQAEKDGRICSVPHDPTLPVITSWDLGMNDSTSIVFWQIAGAEIRAIDFMEFQNTGLPDIAVEVQRKPYRYCQHIGPHDIRVREFGSGKSRLETARSLGIDFDVAPQAPVRDGIEAFRGLIPRIWFDKTKCRDLVEHLTMYRADYNEKNSVFNLQPIHDSHSHAADSCRYFGLTPHRTESWGSTINYANHNYA